MPMCLRISSLACVVLLLLLMGSSTVAAPPAAGPLRTDPQLLRRAAMNNGGNATRGMAVFASATAKCAACHKVHGQGNDAGPDLSQIGGKFDRTHLIESILDPSTEILQGYRSTIIETKAGRVISGIIKTESPSAVVLVDAEGKRISVPPGEIATRA